MEPRDPTRGRSAGTPENPLRDPTRGRSAGTPENPLRDPTRARDVREAAYRERARSQDRAPQR